MCAGYHGDDIGIGGEIPLFNGQEHVNAAEKVTSGPDEDTAVEGDINVEKIPNLPDDYIMGMDLSSYISLRQSGVVFRDHDGNEIDDQTFFNALKSYGITHTRVRVWNDPYDADRNGYGGGNCDLDKAKTIGKWSTEAGLGVLIDFQYSDFWADSGKQQAPKEWAGLSLDEKAAKIKEFTRDSLTELIEAGADVDMVQIGNETTNGLAGETDADAMCTLFQAASEGVSEVEEEISEEIKTVLHLADPKETGQLAEWAARLQTNGVDYDILATSYYPYRNGTLENLKSQLQTVRETYGKDVMVAETGYAYTLEDSDGQENTVRAGSNDSMDTEKDYAFTPQGQADFLRDLMAAVNEAGGLGVFYWEPAWITTGDTTGLTGAEYEERVGVNKHLWENYGSGWASGCAAAYDTDYAGAPYGSKVDNQAMFYPDGSPVESINVWKYVRTGSISYVSVDSIQNCSEVTGLNGTYTLPGKVTVTYSNGAVDEEAEWDYKDIAEIDTSKTGAYVVNGKVRFSKEVNTGSYSGVTEADVTYTLTVREDNLIMDSDAAGFETADSYDISGNGITLPSTEDVLEGNGSLHWNSATAMTGTVTYTGAISLKAGWHTFETTVMGCAGDTVTLNILDADGNVLFSGDETVLTGRANSQAEYLAPSVTFRLEEDTAVTYQLVLGIQNGGWGSADAAYFHRHETVEYTDNNDGTRDVSCADCGMHLAAETIPAEEEDPEEDITVPAEDEDGTGSEPPAGGEGTDAAPPAQPGGTDTENAAKDAAVETGDETVIMPYGVILFLSACVVLVTALTGRKSKR